MIIFNQKTLSALIAGALVFGTSSVVAQEEAIEKAELEAMIGGAKDGSGAYYTDYRECKLSSPSEVHRFELLCGEATYLEVSVEDITRPYNDHWRVTVQANNAYESVGVAESPDKVPARVYNGYLEPTYLKAAVACRYVADGYGSPQITTGWGRVHFQSDASYCELFDHGVQYDEPDAL